MITIHLWLHPRVMQLSNMSTHGKTVGHGRPRHPVLQILCGIIHRANIDFNEWIWEEFVQSIQSFITDMKRLTMPSRGKKKTSPLYQEIIHQKLRVTTLIFYAVMTFVFPE
ncbi:hypothetical protein Tco_1080448 [Tanacetum coccineum]|uniref:Uncharacterized protein n=1 Tax=Tanacetum coccineum TaxID=301880 RepID=A0ABQ5HUQ8_9ASTR